LGLLLSGNSNISEAFFEKHINKVNWPCLSENTNISEAFFEQHIDKVDWDYCYLVIVIYLKHSLNNILIKLIGVTYQIIILIHISAEWKIICLNISKEIH